MYTMSKLAEFMRTEERPAGSRNHVKEYGAMLTWDATADERTSLIEGPADGCARDAAAAGPDDPERPDDQERPDDPEQRPTCPGSGEGRPGCDGDDGGRPVCPRDDWCPRDEPACGDCAVAGGDPECPEYARGGACPWDSAACVLCARVGRCLLADGGGAFLLDKGRPACAADARAHALGERCCRDAVTCGGPRGPGRSARAVPDAAACRWDDECDAADPSACCPRDDCASARLGRRRKPSGPVEILKRFH